jgi:hypothetical protein
LLRITAREPSLFYLTDICHAAQHMQNAEEDADVKKDGAASSTKHQAIIWTFSLFIHSKDKNNFQ